MFDFLARPATEKLDHPADRRDGAHDRDRVALLEEFRVWNRPFGLGDLLLAVCLVRPVKLSQPAARVRRLDTRDDLVDLLLSIDSERVRGLACR